MLVVPMRERLGHTTIRPVQFAFGMGDCYPVAGMVVIAGIVREVVARPGARRELYSGSRFRRLPPSAVSGALPHQTRRE
jgi:hypothetical protein